MVGLDISERMIQAARRKSEALNARALWYCCDVLEAPPELDGTADLVYTGRGALSWIMDIATWSRTVARLLKPGGRLYVFEGHPLDWVWDHAASELRIDPQPPYGDYFSQTASVDKGWPETYIPAASLPPTHEKHQRTSDNGPSVRFSIVWLRQIFDWKNLRNIQSSTGINYRTWPKMLPVGFPIHSPC